MSLTAWRRRFRSSLQTLTHILWPPTTESLHQEWDAALASELQRRHQRLVRIRKRLESWRGRLEPLGREEQQLALMVQRLVQDGKEQEAYDAALVLEGLRKKQGRLCDLLIQGEAIYQQQRQRFQLVKQQGLAQPRSWFFGPT